MAAPGRLAASLALALALAERVAAASLWGAAKEPVREAEAPTLPEWVAAAYLRYVRGQEHLVLEAALLAVIAYLLTRKSFKPASAGAEDRLRLSAAEIDDLCAEWEPEPLVPKPAGASAEAVEAAHARAPAPSRAAPPDAAVEGLLGAHAVVAGRRCLNLGTPNYLGLQGHPGIMAACERTIEKYGCGSCGPRGFYGTLDVHLDLEAATAAFLGVEEAILYSYDAALASSVLPAFCKRGDFIVADERVGFPVQAGLTLSRSVVRFFKHNDPADLERVLRDLDGRGPRPTKKGPTNRRFIVMEGAPRGRGRGPPRPAPPARARLG